MSKEINFFNKNGYVIFRNVFKADEISHFKNLVSKTLDEDLKSNRAEYSGLGKKKVYYTRGDILTKPLSELLLNNKIIDIATKILGETPCYFGEGNYQVGVGDRGFHRDMADEIINGKSTRIYGNGPDWTEDYKLIRVGVYLQDHDKYSGGVKLEKGSNKLPFYKGKRVLADTKAGDVILWDLRTFHSGNCVRLKGFPNLPLGRRIENLLPNFLKISEPGLRNSVFMVFGADNMHLHRHIQKHYKVKFEDHISKSKYSEDMIAKCEEVGVKFIKLN